MSFQDFLRDMVKAIPFLLEMVDEPRAKELKIFLYSSAPKRSNDGASALHPTVTTNEDVGEPPHCAIGQ